MVADWGWEGLPARAEVDLERRTNLLLRAAFTLGVTMLGTTALADPPIINGGEAPQIGRARVYEQSDVPVYTYRILATYPHDTRDYTEALFMHDGYLYEGTGQYGKSRLKKSQLATGEIISGRELDPRYFGEGAVALNGKVYHLTYISNTGFIYRHDDLSPEKRLNIRGRDGASPLTVTA
jgi:glutamine cyclotransferase